MSENKKLSAPLRQMQEDVLRLRGELADYEAEKAEMRRVKAALLVVGATSYLIIIIIINFIIISYHHHHY